MSYWNNAALRGGMSVEDALSSYRGGWAAPANALSRNFTLEQTGETQALDGVYNEILERYNFPPEIFRDLALKVYQYDTAMMRGDKAAIKWFSDWKNASPQRAKLFTYVRKKIHTYGSNPQKMNKAMRAALAANAAKAREARLAHLKLATTPWVGSNPYTGQRSRRAGTYKGLFQVPPRQRNLTPYKGTEYEAVTPVVRQVPIKVEIEPFEYEDMEVPPPPP